MKEYPEKPRPHPSDASGQQLTADDWLPKQEAHLTQFGSGLYLIMDKAVASPLNPIATEGRVPARATDSREFIRKVEVSHVR